MTTRADFYIGQGETAEWLGSIAMDGYPSGIPKDILFAKNEMDYKLRVQFFLNTRRDSTFPHDGWPWPWNDGRLTDYSYAFFGGETHACYFGYFWFDPKLKEPEDEKYEELTDADKLVFPNMEKIKNVRWDIGSGLIIVTN